MIDDVIYFTAEEVMGGELLKEGDRVNCTALRDSVQGGWKAVRVRNLLHLIDFVEKKEFYTIVLLLLGGSFHLMTSVCVLSNKINSQEDLTHIHFICSKI